MAVPRVKGNEGYEGTTGFHRNNLSKAQEAGLQNFRALALYHEPSHVSQAVTVSMRFLAGLGHSCMLSSKPRSTAPRTLLLGPQAIVMIRRHLINS